MESVCYEKMEIITNNFNLAFQAETRKTHWYQRVYENFKLFSPHQITKVNNGIHKESKGIHLSKK